MVALKSARIPCAAVAHSAANFAPAHDLLPGAIASSCASVILKGPETGAAIADEQSRIMKAMYEENIVE